MCGIAGVMTRDGTPPDPALLDRLQAGLAHRGPDGQGRLVRGGVALVHTRLAIIDLDTGDQPLFAPGGSALVANYVLIALLIRISDDTSRRTRARVRAEARAAAQAAA